MTSNGSFHSADARHGRSVQSYQTLSLKNEDRNAQTSTASIPAWSLNESGRYEGSTSVMFNSASIPQKAQTLKCEKKRHRWLTSASWTWEILATILSVFCQGAIVVILAMMADQPLSHWTASVSINAFVAALTTATKSLMLFSVAGCLGQLKWIYFQSRSRQLYHLELFDELVKGPLGAVQMLCRVRWGAAYLGVIITLLALAIDPFAQQVVSFKPQDIVEDDPSVSFGITHNYTASARLNAFMAVTGKSTKPTCNHKLINIFRKRCRDARGHHKWAVWPEIIPDLQLYIKFCLGGLFRVPRIHQYMPERHHEHFGNQKVQWDHNKLVQYEHPIQSHCLDLHHTHRGANSTHHSDKRRIYDLKPRCIPINLSKLSTSCCGSRPECCR